MEILLKRGNTAQNDAYTGPLGSITIDTQARKLRIHDGVTAGGKVVANMDDITTLTTAVGTKLNASEKGVANGVATLDANGLVPSSQLPSYVDDVLEYTNLAAFPGTGETGKIYIALDTGKIYRWSGSVYINISSSVSTADAATKLATARTIGMTGDVTWTSAAFDGTGNVTGVATLANSGVTAGTYTKVTVDAKGRVTVGAGLAATDIPSLDVSKLTTGTLSVARGGTGQSTAVAGAVLYGASSSTTAYTAVGTAGQALISNGASAPTWATLDLTYLPDAAFKKSVKAATTANITLSGAQTVDGIALVAGDRVLVKDQTTANQNGIYIVAAGAWTRSADADTVSKLAGAIVNVDAGTTNGGELFTTGLKTTDTLGTTSITWSRVVDTTMAGTVVGSTPGTASAGTSVNYAREDHVHPVQTTITGNAGTATKLATARTISTTGDATWSVSFDGSANATAAITLATVATAGTYRSVTVDAKGRVTAGTNPTTLAGYGITDAAPSSHVGAGGAAHAVATTSVHGFMSSTDKTKLDGLVLASTAEAQAGVNATNLMTPALTISLLQAGNFTLDAGVLA